MTTEPAAPTPVSHPATPGSLHDLDAYGVSFEAVRAELLAEPADKLEPLNFDIVHAAGTVSAALPAILTYREELRSLPHLDQGRIDRAGLYLEAAVFAQTQWFAAVRPPPPIGEAVAVCNKHRENLLLAAEALAARDMLPAERVKAVRQAVGQHEAVTGVTSLVAMFGEAWGTVGAHTAVTEAELKAASAAAHALLLAIGVRDRHDATIVEWTDLRHRAASFFIGTYNNQLRRGLSFLRWNEGDLNEIAPTVFAHTAAAAAAASHKDPPADPAATPAAPAAAKPATPAATLAAMTAPGAHPVPQSNPFGGAK